MIKNSMFIFFDLVNLSIYVPVALSLGDAKRITALSLLLLVSPTA